MATCPDCGNESRDDAKFCDACGAKLGLAIAAVQPLTPAEESTDEPSVPWFDLGEGDVGAESSEDADLPESTPESSEDEDLPESTPEPSEDAEAQESTAETETEPDATESEGAELVDTGEGQQLVLEEPPKAGYLVFPDNTEQPIPPSQWLIGRADLSKYLADPKQANEISRGHLTVFQEGDKFFIEDGATMVQRRVSTNKTWLVRASSRILVTGKGRIELQDADEIDVAELVKLQFVMK